MAAKTCRADEKGKEEDEEQGAMPLPSVCESIFEGT